MLSLYVNPLIFNCKKNEITLGKDTIEWKKQVATVSKKKGFTQADYLTQKYGEKIGGKNGTVLFAHFDYVKIDDKETTIYLMYSPNSTIEPTELYFDLQIPSENQVELDDESHDIELTDEKIIIQGEVYGFCLDNETYYFKKIDIPQYIEYVQRNKQDFIEYKGARGAEALVDEDDNDDDEDNDEADDDDEAEDEDDEVEDDDEDEDEAEDDDEAEAEDEYDDEYDDETSVKNKAISNLTKGTKGSSKKTEDDLYDEDEDDDLSTHKVARGASALEDDEVDDEVDEEVDIEENDEAVDGEGEGECDGEVDCDDIEPEPELEKPSKQKKVKTSKTSKPTKNLKLSNNNVDLSIIFNILIEESKTIITPDTNLHPTRKINIEILKTIKLPMKTIQMIEKGIYNYAIDKCNFRILIPIWENPEFVEIYISKAKHIYSNLNVKSYVKNTSLITKVKNGEILPYDLPFMETHKLFPEVWIDIIDVKTKTAKMIKESMQACATDLFECDICHERRTIVSLFQMKSGDESETKFITCLNCNNKWKID